MPKTIEAKAENKKVEEKKKRNKPYIIWFAIVAVVVLFFGFIGYKYLLEFADEIKTKSAEENVIKSPAKTRKAIDNNIDYDNEIELGSSKIEDEQIDDSFTENIENTEISQTEKVQEFLQNNPILEQQQPRIEVDNTELKKVITKQDLMIIYLAAQALQNSASENNFAQNLEFLAASAKKYPTIMSKVSLLKMASKDGLPNSDSLLEEFKFAAMDADKNQDKSVWENVKSSLGDLVKVTKVDGSENNGYALYKHAEIALIENNHETAIEIAEQLDAQDLILEIKNLQRINETIDFIINYTKNMLAD